MTVPFAHRPRRELYLALHGLLEFDSYIHMTEAATVSYLMAQTGGANDPAAVKQIVQELRAEAGI